MSPGGSYLCWARQHYPVPEGHEPLVRCSALISVDVAKTGARLAVEDDARGVAALAAQSEAGLVERCDEREGLHLAADRSIQRGERMGPEPNS